MSTNSASLELEEQVAPKLAFWLVLFGAPTLLLNRAIIPALPGSRSGIERFLDVALTGGSISSQLLALAITLLLIRLIGSSVGAAALGAVERLFVLPIGSAVGFLVVAASAGGLDPEFHLLLAGIASFGLLICARPALRHPSTRAGGILLVGVIVASACFAAARLVALRASIEAIPNQYAMARWLATAGQCFDAMSLLWVVLWISVPGRRGGVLRATLPIALALGAVVLARRGELPDGDFASIVVQRMFHALTREPTPFGPSALGPASDLLAMFLSLGLLAERNPNNSVERRAMGLLLLGRCSLDVPALAGMATAGGLLLAWFTPYRSIVSASTAGPPPPAPDAATQEAAITSEP